MPSIRQSMPLAAIFLLALGATAAPIAAESYDCGDDAETEAVSTTASVVASIISSSQISEPTFSSASSVIPTTISVPTSSASSSTILESVAAATAVSSAASSVSSGTPKSASTSDGTKYMMVFGDSYSSDGFSASSDVTTAALPLGIALPGTTTAGSGMNWVGMSATKFNTSLTFALDFAVYGASTDTSIVRGSTPDIVDQVAEFTADTATSSDVAWTATNTMAVFWIGINDVGNSYWDGAATPIEKIHDQYFAQLQILYDAGVRLFTLFTVPPFDQAPVFASESTSGMDNMRANITAYNSDLTTRLATFKAANSGVTGTIFDTTDSFTTVLSDPTTYGATDTTCMNSDGTTCLWYDNYHPGQAIHKQVAQDFVIALTGTFF